jgi:FdhD protein
MMQEEAQQGYRQVTGCVRVIGGTGSDVDETIALEVPVSVSYNGVYFNVLSCTPRDFEDIAYGVSFSSGIIKSASDIEAVSVQQGSRSYEIDIKLRAGLRVDPSSFRLSSISGMPYRGAPLELSSYFPANMVHLDGAEPMSPYAIERASQGLMEIQRMHRETGATHAAAFVDRDGNFVHVCEDIGRHNAVDKLVGRLVRNEVDPRSGFVFLSSRCALELVNKIARYGIGVIATVSAPTSSVIDFATEANVTLCAFARSNRFTIYTHPERVAYRR